MNESLHSPPVPPVSPAGEPGAGSDHATSAAGLDGRTIAVAFCAFLLTSTTASLFVNSILIRLPRFYMFQLALEWGLWQAIIYFAALGMLWTEVCCRAASSTMTRQRAVLVTASAFWFTTVPFLVVVVTASILNVREAIGLVPLNSHLWQMAVWMAAIAAASKAIQHEAKAPELYIPLFAFAGYGVIIVLNVMRLVTFI